MNELIHLQNTLFDAGSEALGREFREELMKYQQPLNPIVVLDLVAMEGEELSEEALSSIELIPAGARADLAVVASWLDDHDHTDKLVVYAKIRAQSLTQSLQVYNFFFFFYPACFEPVCQDTGTEPHTVSPDI